MNKLETKFLDIDRANRLEDLIALLSNYKTPTNELHEIRIKENRDEYFTNLFKELGDINLRREQILKEFKEQTK